MSGRYVKTSFKDDAIRGLYEKHYLGLRDSTAWGRDLVLRNLYKNAKYVAVRADLSCLLI